MMENSLATASDPISPLSRDRSDVDSDMSPNAVRLRLKTLGQLSKLSNYLAQGKIIGQMVEQSQDIPPQSGVEQNE